MQYFNAAAFALAANATTACQEARPQGLPSCVTRFFAIFFLLAGQDGDSLGHSKKDCWIGYLVTEITTDLVFGTLLIIIIMSWGKEWKCAVSCISSCSRAPAEATVYSEDHHEITLHRVMHIIPEIKFKISAHALGPLPKIRRARRGGEGGRRVIPSLRCGA